MFPRYLIVDVLTRSGRNFWEGKKGILQKMFNLAKGDSAGRTL